VKIRAKSPPPGTCSQKNTGEMKALSHMARMSTATPTKGSAISQDRSRPKENEDHAMVTGTIHAERRGARMRRF
jgi:hypothetical protein